MKRGFNEAAADDRGKLALPLPHLAGQGLASMRPRPMTAENQTTAAVRAAVTTLQ